MTLRRRLGALESAMLDRLDPDLRTVVLRVTDANGNARALCGENDGRFVYRAG